MTDQSSRLDYIDGLRGIAIAMVVLTHAWTPHPPHLWNPIWRHNKMALGSHSTLLDYAANRGYQGVSLFLVVSGFCLAYPIFRRRAEGAQIWFRPSHFFARRVLRILPPYYAALLFFTAMVVLFHAEHLPYLPGMGSGDVGIASVLTHIFLVHNFTPYVYSINSPFWSLALEWQWYWIFPVILVASIRWPIRTALTCLFVAIAWQAQMENAPVIAYWLPGRVFEFCSGVFVARLVVHQFKCPSSLLLGGAVAAVTLAEAPVGTFVGDIGIYQPLYGIAFGLVLLLASINSHARAVCSWSPLVRLGVISYSVYLVHRPANDIVESFSPLWLRSSEMVIPVAAASGLLLGITFHALVERPCMSQNTWRRVGPVLQRHLRWTDWLYGVKASSESAPGCAPEDDVPERASA